jgi:hypothetical protein
MTLDFDVFERKGIEMDKKVDIWKRREVVIIIILIFPLVLISCSENKKAGINLDGTLEINEYSPTMYESSPLITETVTSTEAITTNITETVIQTQETPKLTETPTASPTSTWTLSPEEYQENLVQLLEKQRLESSPCLFGVCLGDDRNKVFELAHALGVEANIFDENQIYFPLSPDAPRTYIEANLTIQENIVEEIQVRLNRRFQEEIPLDLLGFLKLSSIFENYGQPTEVYVHIQPDVESFFDLHVVYRNIGLVLIVMESVESESPYLLCPNDLSDIDLDFIKLKFMSPKETEYYDYWIQQDEYTMTIQESSGISVEEFYELFLSGDPDPCFTSDDDLW